jgi:hypothetical protein
MRGHAVKASRLQFTNQAASPSWPQRRSDCTEVLYRIFSRSFTIPVVGFFFRRSVSFGPLRINLSKSGVGASVGIKGARLTTTARGTTYITLGSHGFYYRETISTPHRRIQTNSSPQQQAEPAPSEGDIGTANVTELVDSSSADLVKRLNERASMTNPGWLLYLSAILAAGWGVAIMWNGNRPLKIPPLPDVSVQLSADRGNLDEYSILVARYGQPNTVVITQAQTMPIWTATYALADLAIQLAPIGCTDAFEFYESHKNPSTSSSNLEYDSSRKRHPRQPEKSPDCVHSSPLHSVIVRYRDAMSDESLSNEIAQQRLDSLVSHSPTQPLISRGGDTGGPRTSTHRRAQQASAQTVPFDQAIFTQEQSRLDELAKDRQRTGRYGIVSLIVAALLAAVGAVLHRKNRRSRMTQLIYELDEAGQENQQVLEKSIAWLASSQIVWRIVAKSSTYDWKRNAGAGYLVKRTRVSLLSSVPPRVESNIPAQCLNLGSSRLYFLPDIVLYWEGGRFGAVFYDDLAIEQGSTRFIEDDQVPSDARQVDQTWRYVRKDGGPDRRFNDNVRLPVMEYGALTLTSSHGMHILLQASSLQSTVAFVNTIRAFCDRSRANLPPPSSSTSPKVESSSEIAAFTVLGLDPNASTTQITEAYKKLAQMYHPDKVAGLGPELQDVAERKMKEINAAYEALRSRKDSSSVHA